MAGSRLKHRRVHVSFIAIVRFCQSDELTNHETEQCIDLQYLRAVQNNPVGLYNCAGLANSGAADKGINWPLANVTTALRFSA
jgi:hypothetical protein